MDALTNKTNSDFRITQDLCHSFLIRCAKSMALCSESETQAKMVSQFSDQVQRRLDRQFSPHVLPCLDSMDLIRDMKLAKDFQIFAKNLPWEFSPRTVDQGHDVAVLNFNNIFDMGNVAAGLIYTDIDKNYPEHNHPPAELYFLISGTANWRWGGNHEYQAISAGNIIYNQPYNWHGVKAGATPVLALYIQSI